MSVADTSALYGAMNRNDPHHERALRRLQDEAPVVIPAEIWSETLALLQHRHGHDVAQAAARTLRTQPNIEVQPTPDDFWDDISGEAASIHAKNARLSYPDAVVVAWCRKRRLSPWAYDDALLAACQP